MISKMERFQVYLDPGMSKELDKIAARMGVSKAELIRTGIKKILQENTEAKDDPIFGIVGLGHSGHENVSVEHDRHLAEIKLGKMRR